MTYRVCLTCPFGLSWLKGALILKAKYLRDLVIPECQTRTLLGRFCHHYSENLDTNSSKRSKLFQVEKTNLVGIG
jgi:hypothetical protein